MCLSLSICYYQSTERSDSEEVNFIRELVKKILIVIARPARLLECLVRFFIKTLLKWIFMLLRSNLLAIFFKDI